MLNRKAEGKSLRLCFCKRLRGAHWGRPAGVNYSYMYRSERRREDIHGRYDEIDGGKQGGKEHRRKGDESDLKEEAQLAFGSQSGQGKGEHGKHRRPRPYCGGKAERDQYAFHLGEK